MTAMRSAEMADRTTTFPFGAYDIFSYIIPGLTALLCVFFFEHWIHRNVNVPMRTPVHSMLTQIDGGITKDNLALSAVVLLALTCIVYVSGHLVSSVSSFCLDRVYTAKGCGYPYESLLGIPPENGATGSDSKGFYQGFFFWFNVYLVLRFLSLWSGGSAVVRYGLAALEVALSLVIAAKILQGALRHDQKIFHGIRQRTSILKLASAARLFFAAIFPSHLPLLKSFQKYYKTDRPFDMAFCSRYKEAFKRTFGFAAETAGGNNFWLCRLFIIDKSPLVDSYLSYWLHMYTYARNLATAFYLAFVYCFLSLRLQKGALVAAGPYAGDTLRAMPLLFLLMSVILIARFRYIYVGYYNRFLFRSFVYLNGGAEGSPVEARLNLPVRDLGASL